jgi:2-C-methyl-D-erythritol 4-phosphate cytidylyltransferase
MSDALHFSVLILTAPPPGLGADGGNGAGVKIDGREALLRSVELFLNRDNIPQIQLAVSHEAEEEVKRKFGGSLGFMGIKVVVGGKKWQEQIEAAAPRIGPSAKYVLIHDASRPLVPYGDIDALLEAALKHPAAALAAPLRTSLVEIDEGGNPMAVHAPAAYMQLLSPMVLSRQRFTELAAGKQIHPSELTLVKGSPFNVRIGGSGDGALAKAMLSLMPKPKTKALSNPFEEAQW